MARYRKAIAGQNVLDAARWRIDKMLDTFDSYAVAFSGGKDSQVVLHLVRERAALKGRLPVPIVFRDEEVIPERVVKHMERYLHLDWCTMHWFAVQMKSHKFVLGSNEGYVQWDRARDPSLPNSRGWVRPKPPWAILQPDADPSVYDQYTMDAFVVRTMGLTGKVCLINGMRASESVIRYRSCMSKLHETYIVAADPMAPHVRLGKPIYDWEENDVLKYLWESGEPICETYRSQHLSDRPLRVSTPLHAEASKQISVLRREDPEFYNEVLRVWPDMAMQDRWWGDFDQQKMRDQYGRTFAGCHRYVDRFITDPPQAELARVRIDDAAAKYHRTPGAFPPTYVLEEVMGGRIKRPVTPLKPAYQGLTKYLQHDEPRE